MGVRLIVAVTDRDWFDHLRSLQGLNEVNFWAPSATQFRALTPGELFLFKLHSPDNFIVGGGVFAHANILPCSLAWEAFREANGAGGDYVIAFCSQPSRVATAARADVQDGCRSCRKQVQHPAVDNVRSSLFVMS